MIALVNVEEKTWAAMRRRGFGWGGGDRLRSRQRSWRKGGGALAEESAWASGHTGGRARRPQDAAASIHVGRWDSGWVSSHCVVTSC